MKGKFWRKALAAALALLIVSGGVPVKPFTEIFRPVAITAEAESGNCGSLADFIGDYTDKPIPIEGEVYVDQNITLSTKQSFILKGDTKLIIEKGCTLTLGELNVFVVGENHNLTISGGGTITGKVQCGMRNVNNFVMESGKYDLTYCSMQAITAKNITINGGIVDVFGAHSMYAVEDINLNGGIVLSTEYHAGGAIYVNGVQTDAGSIAEKSLNLSKFKIEWKNYDGTVLKTDTAKYGDTLYYSGATPTKPGNAQYSYTFSGWSPAVSDVTSDTTYTAQFSETVNKYNITLPENMEFVPASETSKFDYNSTVSFKAKDGYTASNVKANGSALTADENGVYTVTVEGDVTVSAEYESEVPQGNVITLNENGKFETDVHIDSGTIDYTFTPAENGVYRFYSASKGDTYAYLLNADESQITYNDDDGEGSNFKIESELTAGQTYILRMKQYSENEIDFKLTAEKMASYRISVSDNITHGTVTADKDASAQDRDIYLTLNPKTGYKIANITVMQGDTPINVGVSNSNISAENPFAQEWFFVMPAGDVSVSAEFAPITDIPADGVISSNGVYSFTPDETGIYKFEFDSYIIDIPIIS